MATTTSMPFQWFFGSNNEARLISQCNTIKVTILAGPDPTVRPVPPYYFFAYPANDIPTGINVGNLQIGDSFNWQVAYRPGTNLILGMTDSASNSGGLSTQMYNVASSGSTSCLPKTSTAPSFSINLNATLVSTCDPLGVQFIGGGAQPYTVTIVSANASSVTNATLGSGDNRYTYISRIPPGSDVIVAASDSSKNYAVSSPAFRTVGSADTSCGNLISSSSSNSSVPQDPNNGGGGGGGGSNTGAIVGGVVGGIVGFLILAVLAFLGWRYYNRRRGNIGGGIGVGGGGGRFGGPSTYPPSQPNRTGQMSQLDPSSAGTGGRTSFNSTSSPEPVYAAYTSGGGSRTEGLRPLSFRITKPDPVDDEENEHGGGGGGGGDGRLVSTNGSRLETLSGSLSSSGLLLGGNGRGEGEGFLDGGAESDSVSGRMVGKSGRVDGVERKYEDDDGESPPPAYIPGEH